MIQETGVQVDSPRLGDLGAVARLITAYESRIADQDANVRPALPFEAARRLAHGHLLDRSVAPVVVRDRAGAPLAYAVAGIWDVTPGSEMRGFYAPRNGVCSTMIVPPATDPAAAWVIPALLDGLEASWRESGTSGEVLTIPVGEIARNDVLVSALAERGYAPTFVQATRPPDALPPGARPTPAGFVARAAVPRDEPALRELHIAEVSFHLDYCPFVRIVPSLDSAFRRQLARVWAGASPTADAPLVTVVEHGGEVVAMAECYLQTVSDGTSYLPAGRYGYLNSVGVREDLRGRGIGRLLVRATFERLRRHGVGGYTLYYLPANPLSSRFWPSLGFAPILSRYQRRRD